MRVLVGLAISLCGFLASGSWGCSHSESGGASGGAGEAAGGAAPTSGSPAEGTYVLALSLQVSKNEPLLFRADVSFSDDPSAPAFTLKLTPLRTPYRSEADNEGIESMAALPPALDLGPFDMETDGSFTASLPEVRIPGEANPVTSSDLQGTFALEGRFSESQNGTSPRLGFLCGTLEGQLSAPIRLDLGPEKNSFAMTQFEGAAPSDVAHGCID